MRKKLHLILGAAAMVAATPLRRRSRAAMNRSRSRAPSSRGSTSSMSIRRCRSVARRRQRPQNWLAAHVQPRLPAAANGAPNSDVRRSGARPAAISGDLGPPAADQDPGRASLKRGSTGKRVALLRTRLGLAAGGGYDEQLFQAVSAYQAVHGLGPADGIAGKATIASLNRGSNHYARRIAINMERAYRLPTTRTFDRYVVVDSGAAEAYLFDRDRRRRTACASSSARRRPRRR